MGLPPISWHSFKHTHATLLGEVGESLRTASATLWAFKSRNNDELCACNSGITKARSGQSCPDIVPKCSQVFRQYRKWKDELIDVEEVARKMEPRARVELATCRLRIGCSTTELPRHSVYYQQFSVNLRSYSSRFSHNSQDVPVSIFRVMTSASSAIAAAFCDSSIIT